MSVADNRGFPPDARSGCENCDEGPHPANLAARLWPEAHRPAAAAEPVAADSQGSSPERLDGQTVWVIDAHSLIHQVFHALPEMTSPRGEPVGAVFGFTRDMLYLLEEKKPDYLFCAFDLPGKTFRHVLYDQYKIRRAEMADDLVPQIPAIRRVIAALGIPALEPRVVRGRRHPGHCRPVDRGAWRRVLLVTGDKDCRQLITDRVKVFNIRKNEVFDRDKLRAEWGVGPSRWSIFRPWWAIRSTMCRACR